MPHTPQGGPKSPTQQMAPTSRKGVAAASIGPAIDLHRDARLGALPAHRIDAFALADQHADAMRLGLGSVDGLAARRVDLRRRTGRRHARAALIEKHDSVPEHLERTARLITGGAEVDAAEAGVGADRAGSALGALVAQSAELEERLATLVPDRHLAIRVSRP